MSAVKDKLRARRILNTQQLVREYAAATGRPGVYVSYQGRFNERSPIGPRWQVVRPGFKTDPAAGWYDYGCKSFPCTGYGRFAPERIAAIGWASERYRYPISDWADSPLSAQESVPGAVVAWARQLVGLKVAS